MKTRIADTGIKVEDEEIEDIEEEEDIEEDGEEGDDDEVSVTITTVLADYPFLMSSENADLLSKIAQVDDWVTMRTASGNDLLIRCSQIVMILSGPESMREPTEEPIFIVSVE